MIGLVVELLVSWLLLWLFNRSNPLVLGIKPTEKRIVDFSFGFISSSIISALSFILIAGISNSTLSFNPRFTITSFFSSSFWMLKSVLYEEFLFRGALLYIAIKKLGTRNACILSALAFGVYHWFSYNLIGNIPQMIYILLLTGVGGLLFAYAFAFTKSMYLPIGLHFGWNLISVVIFSQGPLGNQMLIISGGHRLDGIWTVIFFLYQIGPLPLVTYLYLRKRKLAVEKNVETKKQR